MIQVAVVSKNQLVIDAFKDSREVYSDISVGYLGGDLTGLNNYFDMILIDFQPSFVQKLNKLNRSTTIIVMVENVIIYFFIEISLNMLTA